MVGRSMDEATRLWQGQDRMDYGSPRFYIRAKVIAAAQAIATRRRDRIVSPPYAQEYREYRVAVEEGTADLPYEADREWETESAMDAMEVDSPVGWVSRATLQQPRFWEEFLAGQAQSNCPDTSQFESLAKGWKKAHAFSSSATRMATHPDYQQIIAMGTRAIPLILNDLKEKPDHWFMALQEITGKNPVPDGARGKLTAMAEAWIRWGEKNSYI